MLTNRRLLYFALNPHASDEGLIGTEEETIIKPAIRDAKQHNILAFGPFSSDAFFAGDTKVRCRAGHVSRSGAIPFKSLCIGEGVNYTAGCR